MGDLLVEFERAVARKLTHRQSISEVFVTDVHPISADTFVAGIQLPRRHALFGSPATRLDSHLIIEIIRQLTIVTCHTFYDVPLTSKFLMSGIGCVIDESAETAFAAGGSTDCVGTLRGRDVVLRPSGELRSIRVDVEVERAGVVVATGHGDAIIASPGVYRRIRGARANNSSLGFGRGPGDHLEPATVGHSADSDVVLAASGVDQWRLSVDTMNPFYFDHPLDHVPGVLAIEAARQAIRVAEEGPQLDLARVEVSLAHVLEFGEPIDVQLLRAAPGYVVELLQAKRIAVRVVGEPRATRSKEAHREDQ